MLEIGDVPAARRYDSSVEGRVVGRVDYRRVQDRLVALHTEVEAAYAGRGIGSKLVRRVLDDARAGGLKVTPRCPLFVAHFERHPEDGDLLAMPPR
jgi:predicted GNAT family acetyltransferase